MIPYERKVRFEDADQAGIVFFARYFNYCHEAMEHFFGGLEGGYVGLITKRHIGFPAVHLEANYRAPLRYGETARIEVSVLKIGTTSCTLRYELIRAEDGVHAATIDHVTVSTHLTTLKKMPLPPDCRQLLEAHLVVPAS